MNHNFRTTTNVERSCLQLNNKDFLNFETNNL